MYIALKRISVNKTIKHITARTLTLNDTWCSYIKVPREPILWETFKKDVFALKVKNMEIALFEDFQDFHVLKCYVHILIVCFASQLCNFRNMLLTLMLTVWKIKSELYFLNV